MMEARVGALARRFDAIEKQIADLQRACAAAAVVSGGARSAVSSAVPAASTGAPHESLGPHERDTPRVTQLKKWAVDHGLRSARFVWVPSDYYTHTLQWRRDVLGAPSIYHLCKTIVLENTHHASAEGEGQPSGGKADKHNSRFYMLVFPYTERYDAEKVMRFIKSQPGNEKLGKKKFNFRMADEAVQEAMTGFTHGAVAPFGALQQDQMPVILSDTIRELTPQTFMIGAGHVDCKAELNFAEYVAVMDPLVGPVTSSLTAEELASIMD